MRGSATADSVKFELMENITMAEKISPLAELLITDLTAREVEEVSGGGIHVYVSTRNYGTGGCCTTPDEVYVY